ncbi:Uncharacterised protein [Legionella pneumophila]|nr:Uncharacterised protein [Legionella pneumophila]
MLKSPQLFRTDAIAHTFGDLGVLSAWNYHTTYAIALQQNQRYQSFPELRHHLPVWIYPFPAIPDFPSYLYFLLVLALFA